MEGTYTKEVREADSARSLENMYKDKCAINLECPVPTMIILSLKTETEAMGSNILKEIKVIETRNGEHVLFSQSIDLRHPHVLSCLNT